MRSLRNSTTDSWDAPDSHCRSRNAHVNWSGLCLDSVRGPRASISVLYWDQRVPLSWGAGFSWIGWTLRVAFSLLTTEQWNLSHAWCVSCKLNNELICLGGHPGYLIWEMPRRGRSPTLTYHRVPWGEPHSWCWSEAPGYVIVLA